MAPWDGLQNYTLPPGTEGIPDTTIESDKYNTFLHDLRDSDLNTARPIHRGGTGATTAPAARTNLKTETALTDQVVTNYDSQVWQNGSFISAAGATGSPDGAGAATNTYVGTAYNDGTSIVVEARNISNLKKYTRSKVGAGAWTVWALDSGPGQFVLKSGDTMSGDLTLNKANPQVQLNALAAGQSNILHGAIDGKSRWVLMLGDGTVESGANAGSLFRLRRYNDAGVGIDDIIVADRVSGLMTIKGDPTTGLGIATKQYVDGVGSTKLPLAGGTLTGDLTLTKTVPAVVLNSTAAAGTNVIEGQHAGVSHWKLFLGEGSAEGAVSDGSHFAIQRFNNAGAAIDFPFVINRSTGEVQVSNAVSNVGALNRQTADSRYLQLSGGTVAGPFGVHNAPGSAAGTIFLGNTGTRTLTYDGAAIYSLAGGAYNSRAVVLQVASITDSLNAGYFVNARGANDSAGLWGGHNNAGTVTSVIRGSGGFESAINSYGAISDRRLKQNICDATPKLDGVMKIPIVNFEFKFGKFGKQLGVVDDDVAAIWPGLVYHVEANTVTDLASEEVWTQPAHNVVKSSILFGPVLMKAFQEFVEETRRRLDKLES